VKIWTGYGSEHSSKLKMIGHFRDEEAAKVAELIFQRLRDRVYEDMNNETYDASEDEPDLSDEMADLLRDLKQYLLGPADIENFAFDHSVSRHGADLVLTTDEYNIGGFVKILVDAEARIEIFSLHSHDERGERRTDE
jgi:hypothetical protein